VPERLVLESTGEVVGAPVNRAASLAERARGLLGTAEPPDGVLVLERARQVHTFGMRYPIDVVFCDRDWKVVYVVRALRPGRVTRWVRRARYAVELSPRAQSLRIEPGDALRLEPY
jgi:uncharacterized membrane protein (UPF0127 family)